MTADTFNLDTGGAVKTCGGCEYFDRHYGDCLRSSSPRFQAEHTTPACHLFYPSTSSDAEDQP